ncbi:MAG TPA: VIT and VWA domain-containing protein [candidate division Zixibacteria bacterium]
MKKVSLIISFFLLLTSNIWADGFIIPVPRYPEEPPPPYLSIKYHNVEIKIDNQVAQTTVDQVFKNDFPHDLEGTYIFPLPEDASISKFSMFIKGEEVKGEILDREKAKRIYEEIVRRRKDPALLEYYNQGMFRARVYPIPANGETRIKLGYSQILKLENGLCEYKYSLSTEKFSRNPLESVRIELVINSDIPIKNVYSPTQEIKVERENDHRVKVSYFEENTKPNKDFVLYYTLSEEEIGFNLLSYQDEKEGNFFMALFSPQLQRVEKPIRKKIIFLLDTSGSMQGEKIQQAKNALIFCLNGLNPGDSFNLIDFDDRIKTFKERLLLATKENIDSGVKFIQGCEAEGGTDINSALSEGLSEFNPEDKTSYLIFLTDGLPTVGVTDIKKILENIRARNSNGRIFVFGVGFDVNTHFLDRLAKDNHAASDYVTPNEDIEVKVSDFYKKISNPILSDLSLKFSGVKTFDLYPGELPDLFSGSQIIVLGKYEGEGISFATLTGYTNEGRETHSYNLKFSPDEENSFIPRLWAMRRIGYLSDQIRLYGKNTELVDEIVHLSKRYGIITQYTSFLVDTDRSINVTADRPIIEKGVTSNLRTMTGSEAVYQALKSQELQSAPVVPDRYTDSSGKEKKVTEVKQVANKTFFKKGELWVDSEYDTKLKTIKIQRFSPAYFDLARRFPEFEKYLSLGDKVIFVFKDKVIEIADQGEAKIENLKELK